MSTKTVEDKWQAVKEFLLVKIKDDEDASWYDDHGVWQAGWWKPNWKLTVRLLDHKISETLLVEQDAASQSANIPMLYSLFGLEKIDAVEAYKASLQSDLNSMTAIVSSVKKGEQPDYVHVSELEAERAKNAALVAALEDMYLAYGTTVKIGQLNGLRTVQTNIGRDIKHALAANEKGGLHG